MCYLYDFRERTASTETEDKHTQTHKHTHKYTHIRPNNNGFCERKQYQTKANSLNRKLSLNTFVSAYIKRIKLLGSHFVCYFHVESVEKIMSFKRSFFFFLSNGQGWWGYIKRRREIVGKMKKNQESTLSSWCCRSLAAVIASIPLFCCIFLIFSACCCCCCSFHFGNWLSNVILSRIREFRVCGILCVCVSVVYQMNAYTRKINASRYIENNEKKKYTRTTTMKHHNQRENLYRECEENWYMRCRSQGKNSISFVYVPRLKFQ